MTSMTDSMRHEGQFQPKQLIAETLIDASPQATLVRIRKHSPID